MTVARSLSPDDVRRLSGDITLTREGLWLHEGQEITHERTKKMLFANLYFDGKDYFLKGEQLPVPVKIEDTPYFVLQLKPSPSGDELVLSDGSAELFDPATVYFNDRAEPNCLVKNGASAARLTRPVYYELMKNLTECRGYLGLLVKGIFYPLKRKETLTAVVPQGNRKISKAKKLKKKSEPRSVKKPTAKSKKKKPKLSPQRRTRRRK